MNALAPSTSDPAQTAVFDRWANVYDHQQNPLLMLEARCAEALLPPIAGAAVVDAGCGTGRWLRRLEHLGASSLLGIDTSPAMLARASATLSPHTALRLGSCSSMPAADASCDLLLSSFVLSYLDDLSAFARECARLLRPGGTLLLTDMHPVTAAERHWKRSFHVDQTTTELAVTQRSLAEIIAAFTPLGFAVDELQEPSFGLPERPIFAAAGKLAEYEELLAVPAIYLLKLRKHKRLRLTQARWSVDARTWSETQLTLEDKRIALPNDGLDEGATQLDLSGYVLLPGLINAHDHLEFGLFPNLGRDNDQAPYRNATEWANEIHGRHADIIAAHLRVPLKTRLWWGALRNLCCGVTSVCHHNPQHPELNATDFPVRVVSDFGWAHSLAFEAHLVERHRATGPDQPFIVHAAEGVDEQSRHELRELERLHILDERTVLVHALALAAEELARVNQAGASILLCPSSNSFLFHRNMPAHLLAGIARAALGSDSPLTAAGDLLDELQFLRREQSIAAETLYRLVTSSPAGILKLQNGEGTITADGLADLIAVRRSALSPAYTLASLTCADIELVLLAGRVQLASASLYERLPLELRAGLHLLSIAGALRWVRAPLKELFADAEQCLGKGNLRLGGKEISLVDAH